MLLLALETATMPAYVLMGFDRDRERSLEGALKYFLLSMVASLLFLYGLVVRHRHVGLDADRSRPRWPRATPA